MAEQVTYVQWLGVACLAFIPLPVATIVIVLSKPAK